jgi:hypothetical protein
MRHANPSAFARYKQQSRLSGQRTRTVADSIRASLAHPLVQRPLVPAVVNPVSAYGAPEMSAGGAAALTGGVLVVATGLAAVKGAITGMWFAHFLDQPLKRGAKVGALTGVGLGAINALLLLAGAAKKQTKADVDTALGPQT